MVELVGHLGVTSIGVVVDGVVAGGVFQVAVHGYEFNPVVLDANQEVVHELQRHDGLYTDHLVEIHAQ